MSEEQVTEVSEAPEVAQSVEDWRSNIPEDIRGHKSLDHIPDVGALAKSYVHAQAMIGADKIVMPGKTSTQEDWDEFYNRIGRPQSSEEYNLPEPQEFEADPDMTNWYRQAAHEIGLTENQAAKLYEAYNNFAANQGQSSEMDYQVQLEQTQQELMREFGDAYEDRINQGFGVVSNFGDPELLEVQMADGTLLGDNPEFIRLMGRVGDYIQKQVGEDSLEGVRTAGGISPEEALAKVAEIKAKGSPFWDRNDPRHDQFVQDALKYQELATR